MKQIALVSVEREKGIPMSHPYMLPAAPRKDGGAGVRTSDRNTLLQLLASLTLCDHMGDVGYEIKVVLKRLGIPIEWEELREVRIALGKMGVTTLSGVIVRDDVAPGTFDAEGGREGSDP